MSSMLKMRGSENSEVRPDPHRAQPNVEIRESNREEAQPRKELVTTVQARHTRVAGEARTRRRDLITAAADEVPQRMAAERVCGKQQHVDRQHERADAD